MYYLLIFTYFISLSSFSAETFYLDLGKFRSKLKDDHSNLKVTYKNHLGEGPGMFDSKPRYNPDEVNCTTWWQQLFAESYTKNDKDMMRVLDHIRYFDGVVSFGTRKHFIDHFLDHSPEPLKDVNQLFSSICGDDENHQVKLNINKFKKSAKAQCPILHEDKTDIRFSYLTPKRAISCMNKAPNGLYMAFPIATARYLRIWGKKSGPMGRVHGLIINKEENKAEVYHASIDWGKVKHEPFDRYVLAPGSRLFKGYKIYQIGKTFTPQGSRLTPEELEILMCEKELNAKIAKAREKK